MVRCGAWMVWSVAGRRECFARKFQFSFSDRDLPDHKRGSHVIDVAVPEIKTAVVLTAVQRK